MRHTGNGCWTAACCPMTNHSATSRICAAPWHTTAALTGSRMHAARGHSAPSATYSWIFSVIRATVLAWAGVTQTGEMPPLNWHVISGTVSASEPDDTVLLVRVPRYEEADHVELTRTWCKSRLLKSGLITCSGLSRAKLWDGMRLGGKTDMLSTEPRDGGSKTTREVSMIVAVTTYWAVQIWSRDCSRPNVSQLFPERLLSTMGTEGRWLSFSLSWAGTLLRTDSRLPCKGSTGHSSESCHRIPWVSSEIASLTEWRATTSKTRAWKSQLRILARRWSYPRMQKRVTTCWEKVQNWITNMMTVQNHCRSGEGKKELKRSNSQSENNQEQDIFL